MTSSSFLTGEDGDGGNDDLKKKLIATLLAVLSQGADEVSEKQSTFKKTCYKFLQSFCWTKSFFHLTFLLKMCLLYLTLLYLGGETFDFTQLEFGGKIHKTADQNQNEKIQFKDTTVFIKRQEKVYLIYLMGYFDTHNILKIYYQT